MFRSRRMSPIVVANAAIMAAKLLIFVNWRSLGEGTVPSNINCLVEMLAALAPVFSGRLARAPLVAPTRQGII